MDHHWPCWPRSPMHEFYYDDSPQRVCETKFSSANTHVTTPQEHLKEVGGNKELSTRFLFNPDL